ncbi:MAG: CDP-glucose 4,6-dehydratase [Cognaticolwellia sp.]
MARVLVTGASGILGSACISAMDPKTQVIALVHDRDPASRLYSEGLIERCIEVRGSLAESERILAEYQPDQVLHLAAQTQVPTANHSPLSTFESNLRGTWLLLEACRLANKPPSAILVASSDKAYGPAPLPTQEHHPLAPTAPYDVSKACTDLVARSYATHFGLPIVVSRSANLYGPGDTHTERLVPHCCSRLLQGLPPVLRGTGAMSREWLYVDDAAMASLALLEFAATHRGQAFNIGGGQVASVAKVAQTLVELAGGPPAQTADREPKGEIPHQALDTRLLRQSTGWRPKVDLREGLSRTLAWWQGR